MPRTGTRPTANSPGSRPLLRLRSRSAPFARRRTPICAAYSHSSGSLRREGRLVKRSAISIGRTVPRHVVIVRQRASSASRRGVRPVRRPPAFGAATGPDPYGAAMAPDAGAGSRRPSGPDPRPGEAEAAQASSTAGSRAVPEGRDRASSLGPQAGPNTVAEAGAQWPGRVPADRPGTQVKPPLGDQPGRVQVRVRLRPACRPLEDLERIQGSHPARHPGPQLRQLPDRREIALLRGLGALQPRGLLAR